MNIIIVERLRKANEESKFILINSNENSLKRKEQLMNYPSKNENIVSRLISTIKNWNFLK